MRMMLLVAAMALSLTACASTSEPEIAIQKEKVAVAVDCNVDPGPEPEYPDTAEALAVVMHPEALETLKTDPFNVQALTQVLEDVGQKLKLLLKGRLMRIQRDREKSAAICR